MCNSYPYDMGNGWVVFEEPEDGKVIVGIDPSVGGKCPGGFALVHGYNGVPTCSRALTAGGSVSASYSAPFDVGTVSVDVSYSQYYSADSFASAADTDIDDSFVQFAAGVSSFFSFFVFLSFSGLARSMFSYFFPELQVLYGRYHNCKRQ